MSGFKHFAVAGAGNFGTFIVKELLLLKNKDSVSKVVVLTRSANNSAISELANLGATICEVDYASPASITKALVGIDVLLCAFGATGLSTQEVMAKSAKDAGVKLFVPSEFGGDAGELDKLPFKDVKFNVRRKLEEISLPYTLFHTGIWPDLYFIPSKGFDFANGKVKFGGQGDAPISWTTRRDAARFIAHALTVFPKDKLEGREIRIEGDRQSFNEPFARFEERKSVKLDISRQSREELESRVKANPNDIFAISFLAWDLGGGILENLANGEWPEWWPESVLDVIS
ncbi:NAD-P-binding protein [Schizopora paradoxa]|uniref:NAD-P-binding protein n=1 Tax=Schizopora paradoxa TaxID=27342 RepID=A0A0H2R8H3_9AGAM|nr:NAD-P-binding protein [Schizopora paradoxa]